MSKKNSQQYILTVNAGSTSLKSRVFVFEGGKEKGIFAWSKGNLNPNKSHNQDLGELKIKLRKAELLDKITAVGHRVVHGGPVKKSLKIGKKELNLIKKYIDLAPLHNPFNLEGITVVSRWWSPQIPQVAIFDTAFYAGLPKYAALYALPQQVTKKYGLVRYGFHGISHRYAALAAAKKLNKLPQKLKMITIHLGGGSSITAVDKGKPVDTSMGFTPLEGLVMNTRPGDLDPGIIFHLLRKGLNCKEVKNILVKKSGILGVAGAKNMLDLIGKAGRKNAAARLAFQMFAYRIQKYIGAYYAVLGGCDAIVFTGAVGAGKPITRNKIINPLKKSILRQVPIIVIPPNEEKMIAKETRKLV